MSENKKLFRSIFKATSVLGGVQVINILIGIFRSKILAVLLGPAGIGLASLFNATLGFISSLTALGIEDSAVRNISKARSMSDENKISEVVAVFRKLVLFTGFTGCLIVLIGSPYFSVLTFGNKNYTIAFCVLSVTVLFDQLNSSQFSLLQAMRRLDSLAKSKVIISVVALVLSIPIYYFFRVEGVVPAILISSIVSFLIVLSFVKKIQINKIRVPRDFFVSEGFDMIRMGVMLSLSGLLASGSSYVVRAYISNLGGVSAVGLYSAGFTVVYSYVGIFFTAMGTDYYPRLSEVAHDNEKTRLLINQQAESGILILAPLLCLLLVFVDLVVIALYSEKFLLVTRMIQWALIGVFFKVASWSVSFILIAKGESKIFFVNELIAAIYSLALNLAGFALGGLEGLGISFFIIYILYTLQVFILASKYYDFSFERSFYRVFVIQFFVCCICFLLSFSLKGPVYYVASIVLLMFSSLFSIKEIDKRIGVRELLQSLKNKVVKK